MIKFVGCNCPVGMKYHALNCPTDPGKEQSLPAWLKNRPVTLKEKT